MNTTDKHVFVDVEADNLAIDMHMYKHLDLEVLVNKDQIIDTTFYNGKNKQEVIDWLKTNNAEYKINDNNEIEIKFYGSQFNKLQSNYYVSKYPDGTFGMIQKEELKKTYNQIGKDKFSKKLVAISGICVDKIKDMPDSKKEKISEWLNGKIKFGKDGITVYGKEKEQFIKYGSGDYVVKDTSGDPYPNPAKKVKNLIITDIDHLKMKWPSYYEAGLQYIEMGDHGELVPIKASKKTESKKAKPKHHLEW